MKLEIITPEKKLFEGDVKYVYLPGSSGALGILDHHAPLITTLKEGELRVDTGTEKKSFNVKGGVVEVLNNKVIILAE
ncbi:MAG: ATP synthase F1 subunit epsilon [Flavobacteriales bacterium]